MHQHQLAAVDGDGQPSRGLPIGDMRGFGRVGADAALDVLALDRDVGMLRPSHPERPLLSLHMDGDVAWTAAYVPGTNVLETVGQADGAELRVADFMAVAEGRPGQPEAVAAGRFIRIISCTEGEASFRVACAANLSQAGKTEARAEDGWHLACSRPLGTGAEVAATHVRLAAGESVAFVLSDAPVQGGPGLVAEALHALGDTIHYWTWWSDRCRYKGDDFDARLREALTLKLGCGDGGLLVEAPGAGFARAPMVEAARASAAFLSLGYRGESALLLAQVYQHGLQGSHGRWSFDERFVKTLESYVLRYGTQGLPDDIRQAFDTPPPDLATAL
ncbi:hypothetical protein KPL74_14315 [Bacillus sp. NP157]|nr:hypothetical protein KPL74_14315 [Bacillus sp. NP157]